MLWLRSNRSFNRLLELDPASGESHEILATALGDKMPKKINGFFDRLGDTLVAVHAIDGHLVLRIGTNVISLEEGIIVLVDGPSNNRLLRVLQNGNEVMSVRYSIADAPKFKNDPTPGIDDEDFDFGLFIANIAASLDRRRVALKNW